MGKLNVKLVQASELTNKDLIGKSDPFAVLFIRPLRDRMKTSKTIVSNLLFLHYICLYLSSEVELFVLLFVISTG